jgi:hypothetical protein
VSEQLPVATIPQKCRRYTVDSGINTGQTEIQQVKPIMTFKSMILRVILMIIQIGETATGNDTVSDNNHPGDNQGK